MIVDTIRGNILNTSLKHIAFAINTEGKNDSGVAGQISRMFWKDIASTGEKNLGVVFSREFGDITFHAIVCHSLEANGWKNTPEVVRKCLDDLEIPETEKIAIVLIGSGIVGNLGRADVFAILGGMARSTKKVVIYTL